MVAIFQKNSDFSQQSFYTIDGEPIYTPTQIIIEKFKAITGISQRRYAKKNLTASDIGAFAAKKAISDANIDPESIDYIICAHNFGDVRAGAIQSDIIPCLAARIKYY